jgi:hypothetical protein
MNQNLKNKYLELYEKYGEIKIACKGATELPLDVIADFQGGLKKRTQNNKIKLATQIFKKGFSAPFFIWDYQGTYYALDGHARSEVLCEIREAGIPIPGMYPVAYIEAENEQDAREKLLGITSQYGEFVEEELYEWLWEIDKDIKESLRIVDVEIKLSLQKNNEEKTKSEIELKKQISRTGEIWGIGDKIKLYCMSSEKAKHEFDLLFYDPMFNDDNIYNLLPQYIKGKKLLLFYDLIRCGRAFHTAIEKGWPFNFEFILDGCTSWYVPGRPLERHKGCALFGNEKWIFDKAIYEDGIVRDEQIATNEKGSYNYKPLDSGKHLSSVERWNNAGNDKNYKYEKPLAWIRALINGCVGVSSIFDPFGGTFTPCIVAIENNMEYNGYEINPKIFDIGLMKIYQETGIDPIREDGRSFTNLLLEG